MMARLRTITVALLVVFGAVSCGIPPESEARPVEPPKGPYQALYSSHPPEPEPTGATVERLCFVKDELLVATDRKITAELTVDAVVKDLLEGPTATERTAGIGSALLGTQIVGAVRVNGGIAVVEIGSPIEGAGRNDEVLAVGQVVCTLDARPDVAGVTFVHDGQPVAVPRGDGALSNGPLTTEDYSDLLPSK